MIDHISLGIRVCMLGYTLMFITLVLEKQGRTGCNHCCIIIWLWPTPSTSLQYKKSKNSPNIVDNVRIYVVLGLFTLSLSFVLIKYQFHMIKSTKMSLFQKNNQPFPLSRTATMDILVSTMTLLSVRTRCNPTLWQDKLPVPTGPCRVFWQLASLCHERWVYTTTLYNTPQPPTHHNHVHAQVWWWRHFGPPSRPETARPNPALSWNCHFIIFQSGLSVGLSVSKYSWELVFAHSRTDVTREVILLRWLCGARYAQAGLCLVKRNRSSTSGDLGLFGRILASKHHMFKRDF